MLEGDVVYGMLECDNVVCERLKGGMLEGEYVVYERLEGENVLYETLEGEYVVYETL